MRNGVLEHPPLAERTSVGIASDGTLHADRVSLLGYWQGAGSRLRIGLNDPPGENGFALFTRAYGATTPAESGAAEVVLHPFPSVTANTDLVGTVADVISPSGGKTAIPPDGAVLQARGSGAFRLVGDAPLGSTLTIRYTLNPTWEGIVGAIGGGPVLVKDGKPIFRANEQFTTSQLAPHDPRTAVGQRADGKIIMVAVDGRQPGYSAGVTSFELALAMMQLGCVSASGLDAGGSTTMAFDGQLLNRPSDKGGERSVAEALLVAYTGVYVPPAPAPVLSPNGDGVAESESLAYKVVRPSTVLANLVGPGGVTLPIDAGTRTPGTYKFNWTGDGQPEGSWKFSVTATDDLAQISTAERTFSLNNTLASLDGEAEGAQAAQEATRASSHRSSSRAPRRSRRRSRPRTAPSCASSRAGRPAPEPSGSSGTDAAPPAASRTAARTGCTSRRRTASAASTCTPRSRRAGSLGRCAPREPYELADVVRPRQRHLRRLPADARGRRVPRGERGRHGRGRRARGGSLRRDR